ncbi:MAG: Rieske (2Fe-2S) protein [Planctomyces sp.]
MARWIPLMAVEEISDGGSREVTADGKIFAVFRSGEAVHVIDGICAHAGGPLGKGQLQNGVVTCPWHGWQYHVDSGMHCLNDRICQKKFPVRIVDGQIMVDVSQ